MRQNRSSTLDRRNKLLADLPDFRDTAFILGFGHASNPHTFEAFVPAHPRSLSPEQFRLLM